MRDCWGHKLDSPCWGKGMPPGRAVRLVLFQLKGKGLIMGSLLIKACQHAHKRLRLTSCAGDG